MRLLTAVDLGLSQPQHQNFSFLLLPSINQGPPLLPGTAGFVVTTRTSQICYTFPSRFIFSLCCELWEQTGCFPRTWITWELIPSCRGCPQLREQGHTFLGAHKCQAGDAEAAECSQGQEQAGLFVCYRNSVSFTKIPLSVEFSAFPGLSCFILIARLPFSFQSHQGAALLTNPLYPS